MYKIIFNPIINNLIQSIIDKGYECYLVGGAVRDHILNINNKDYDFAINISLEQLKQINPKLIIMKQNDHRTTALLRINNIDYEFSTYRGNNIYEDLANRDFKFNSMAIDINGNLLDPYNGLKDIKQKQISLTQIKGRGLITDPLRILRALRLSIKYDFKIEKQTSIQMNKKSHLLTNVAKERIILELKQILIAPNIDYYLNNFKTIFVVLIPQLKNNKYNHTITIVKNTPPTFELRLAALFYNIDKSASNEIFNNFASTYKIDNRTKKIVSDLVLYCKEDLSLDNNKIYDFYKKYDMNKIELLIELKRSCIEIDQNKLNKIEEKYILIREKYKQIKYSGNNLIELGYKGKIIGIILDDIKRKIINNNLENNINDINKYVLENYKGSENT